MGLTEQYHPFPQFLCPNPPLLVVPVIWFRIKKAVGPIPPQAQRVELTTQLSLKKSSPQILSKSLILPFCAFNVGERFKSYQLPPRKFLVWNVMEDFMDSALINATPSTWPSPISCSEEQLQVSVSGWITLLKVDFVPSCSKLSLCLSLCII